ncbi:MULTISPECIES: hypothetical protein [Bacillus]|nr:MULTISPECIES: hypothetical protein [Bacillus]MDN5389046.1 hypothetical protein [Bacillus sp. LB7]MEC1025645.1 hypothetical protein [Bacillus paralicheniformis]MEC1080708.1 hypothetical protein [Bacillus paralicheniformis]MEC1099075.1 hypothetical protein [Bacillus paralicheniformis]MEC1126980.1 hypothetical protein [Bacillus paralicheniformis]
MMDTRGKTFYKINEKAAVPGGFSVSTNPRIRCQVCASVLTNYNIRSAPMLDLPRLQGFSITLKE